MVDVSCGRDDPHASVSRTAARNASSNARVVTRIDGAQVAHHRTVGDARDDVVVAQGGGQPVGVGRFEGHADRRDAEPGERAAARHRFGVDDLGAVEHVGDRVRARPQRLVGGRRHPPERDRGGVDGEVREGDRLQRGERELVGSGRAGEGMARDRREQVGAAHDDPGLRAAEQLVARERDDAGTGRDGLADRRARRATTTGVAGATGWSRRAAPNRRRPSPWARGRASSATVVASMKPTMR